ncbi:hypothetical protein TWF225_011344 [Orbilia oligospora]|nr:hypothetical protein TWF225_011344 [Orbilia oligospora]KAF3232645.1 hypothetical protein TWF128_003750 [Orbilia oligospora]
MLADNAGSRPLIGAQNEETGRCFASAAKVNCPCLPPRFPEFDYNSKNEGF